ncbi:MAG: hypothetical protein ACTSQS_06290 [Promethearchaeota archaeon]
MHNIILKIKFTEKQFLIITILIAFILRIIFIFIYGQDQIIYDSHAIALNIISGKGYSLNRYPSTPIQKTCIKEPFYSFFIAFFYLICRVNSLAILFIQIVQASIGAITIIPIFFLTKKFFPSSIAKLSTIIFTFYPDFIYSVAIIHILTISTFIIPSLIYLTISFKENPSYKKAILMGILYGLSLLIEPVIISILFCLLIWFSLIIIYEQFKTVPLKIIDKLMINRLKILFITIIFSILTILPWLIRCSIVYEGRFVFIKANGFNLWRGNNPEYTRTGIPSESNHEYNGLTKEGDIEEFYFNLAINYIFTHIPETIFNFLRKFTDFWGFPNVLSEQSPLIRVIIYIPFLISFLIYLIFNIKKIKFTMPLLIPLISFSLVYSITFVLPRYRVPIQPIMFIFSAWTIEKIINKITKLFFIKS